MQIGMELLSYFDVHKIFYNIFKFISFQIVFTVVINAAELRLFYCIVEF